jgi:hypothetical protein
MQAKGDEVMNDEVEVRKIKLKKWTAPADLGVEEIVAELTTPSLSQLAIEINTAHDIAIEAAREVIRWSMKAGDLLMEAKGRLAHGEFGPWLRENCKVGERQAQRYMKLARERARIEANWEEVEALSIEQAIGWLAPEFKSDFEVGFQSAPELPAPASKPAKPWDDVDPDYLRVAAAYCGLTIWRVRYAIMLHKLCPSERDMKAHIRRAWLRRKLVLERRQHQIELHQLKAEVAPDVETAKIHTEVLLVLMQRYNFDALVAEFEACKANFAVRRLQEFNNALKAA